MDEFTVQIQIIGSHGKIQTDTGLHCLSGEEGAPVFQPGQVSSILLNHMAGKCTVAVNHEHDTCFGNEIVMGYADCKYLAGLVETSKVEP